MKSTLSKNTCAVVVFLFVIFLQTGNSLYAQIDNNPDTSSVKTDTTVTDNKKTPKVKKATIPWKAALMSGLVPGLGQIYNRKYWKLPIVWGALGVTGYFLFDQQTKYIFSIETPIGPGQMILSFFRDTNNMHIIPQD